MANYWDSVTRQRLNRRALLRGIGASGVGVAALSLIGCGGASDGTPQESSGLVSKPVDTSSKAKAGGILERIATNDTAGFDALKSNNATAVNHGNYVYSRLFKFNRAKYPNRADGSVQGDAAAGWEVSADGLTTTIKLRPNMKYDPRPPTNGRALTSADVKFSWDAYAAVNAERDVLSNAVDKDAPVESVTTPDAQTVVIKSAFPYAALNPMFAFRRYVLLMPTESDGGFNVKETMRGTGAWRLNDYKPSISFEYRKNPDWYEANNVHLDGVNITIVPEYTSGLSQFRTGNLWEFEVRADDILQTKRDEEKLVMAKIDAFDRGTGFHMRFGGLPQSAFRDERLRQAASMLLDRELYVDTFGNVKTFRDSGLDVETRWNSAFSAGEEAFWLDPKSTKFGDSAKFYKYDPAAAKALVRAAGFNNGVETEYAWTINQYGNDYQRSAEVIRGMLEANGDFKFKALGVDYQTIWVPQYHTNNGQFNGIMHGSQGARAEIDGWLFGSGKFGTTKSWVGEADPTLDDMVVRQRKELDVKRRTDLLHEIQRYVALHMKWMANPGQALGFNLYWPWMSNKGTYVYYNGGGEIPQENLLNLWYDETQKA